MPDTDADLIPLPPAGLPAPIPLVEEVVAIWRLHWEDDPRAEPVPKGQISLRRTDR